MGVRVEWSCGYDLLAARYGLADLGAVFAWQLGDRLDKASLESWRERWRIKLSDVNPPGASRVLFLKRFDRPPLRHQLARWRQGRWGVSTGRLEWGNAQDLAVAGVSAVAAVGFGEAMAGPWERRSFVALAEVTGESLERWIPRCLPPGACETNYRRRRALCDRLACFVAGFHKAGFVHRDLYLCHIFLDPDLVGRRDDDARPWFTLIDLQRVFRPRWRRCRWVVKDLSSLNFSAPADRIGLLERLRFLCRYVRVCGQFGTARELAGLIAARTARMARRQRVPLAGKWSGAGLSDGWEGAQPGEPERQIAWGGGPDRQE